ncbi:MAG TPA: hypothetical protein VGS57_11180 [Thermoanaerobaculia bacterium]|jgi:hypothetical protein|nr:hypothetical protein [Thermoanaerobaculia bacterium]
MALSDNLHDLEHLIGDAMGNAFESARRVLAEQLHRRNESGLRDARERGFRDLREAAARLDAARTQADVLTALLEEGGRFASRTALLLTFADGARGWAAYGFAGEAQSIEDLRLPYSQPALEKLAGGRGAVTLSAEESAELARQLGGGTPAAAVLVPLVLRDRVAAALYADQLRASDPFVPAALQILAYTAANLLEVQGTRERAATPTLAGIDAAEAGAGLPLWDPSAFEQPAAAEAPASAPVAPAAAAAPSAVASTAVAAAPAPAYTPPPPAPPAPAPAVEEPTVAEPAVAVERPEAPAPWEELPEEPSWAAPPEAPEAAEEPAPTPPAAAAPAWQPSWQMEEAPAAEAAPPAPSFTPAPSEPPVPAEDAWVYADQGYEAESEQTYEGTAVEEVPVEAGFEEDTETFHMSDTGIDATALEAGAEEPVEEVAAEPVEEEVPEETAPWQTPAAAPPAESVTSPLYGTPPYPSEATVRISRDLLQGAAQAPQPDVSEDSTVMLQRPTAVPPPAPLFSPQVAPPPVAPPVEQPRPAPRPAAVFGGGGGAGTTEVQPPPDLEGPGWAFRGGDASTASYRQQSEENSALHEEARRLARLLVSEIKLYNEEQIEEGRRQRDIYPRLQEDIDRSRQMYEERVDAKVRDEVDYFQQEMVNILAGGDAGALGM